MRSQFPLFQSHLDLAHQSWQRLLNPGDFVIDATCGNGHDTLVLCQLVLPLGKVYAMDVQPSAIARTAEMLRPHFSPDPDHLLLETRSHATFPRWVHPQTVTLIVYNLGYLPGGNKSITTLSEITTQSVLQALPLLKSGGAISITAYPGHSEGADELDHLLETIQKLSPHVWSCCTHTWINRARAPVWIFLQKTTSDTTLSGFPNPTRAR